MAVRLDIIRVKLIGMESDMGQNHEYVVRTTHHCMVRIHHLYYTLVHIGWFGPDGEYKASSGPEAPYIYECIGPNGLIETGGADTVEDAFRAGWDAIVTHMGTAEE